MDDGSNGEEGAVDIPSETETFDSYSSNDEAVSPVIGTASAPAHGGSSECAAEETLATSTPRASVDEVADEIKEEETIEEEEEEDTSHANADDVNEATPNGQTSDTSVPRGPSDEVEEDIRVQEKDTSYEPKEDEAMPNGQTSDTSVPRGPNDEVEEDTRVQEKDTSYEHEEDEAMPNGQTSDTSVPRGSVDEAEEGGKSQEEDTSFEHEEDDSDAAPNGQTLDTTADTQDSDTTGHHTDVDTEEDNQRKSDERPEIVAYEDDTSAHAVIEQEQEAEPKINGDHCSLLDTSEERGPDAEEYDEDKEKLKQEDLDVKEAGDYEIDEDEEERLLRDPDEDEDDDDDEGEPEEYNNDSNNDSNSDNNNSSTNSSSSSTEEEESDALVIDESSGLPAAAASKDKRRRPPSSTSATATKSPPAVKETRSPTPEKLCDDGQEKSAEKSHLGQSPKQTSPSTTQEEALAPLLPTPALPPPFSSVGPSTPQLTPHHHYNPYFNESLFELSQQHHPGLIATALSTTDCALPPNNAFSNNNNQSNSQRWQEHQIGGVRNNHNNNNSILNNINRRMKNNYKVNASGPKLLNEYHQYLGLQPSVQFKCSRCGQAGFESLTTLNRHVVQCTEAQPLPSSTSADQSQNKNNNNNQSSSSSFKLTRKVFLCSACGTYYENWNLFLHMVEVHRRYLCLYCLGMFSALNDLCAHIQNRHSLEPGHKNTPQEFFSAYGDPCYMVCCDCGAGFTEQDNFFYHACARKLGATNNNNAGAGVVNNNNNRTVVHNNINASNNQQRTFGLLGHSVVNNNHASNKVSSSNKPASVGARQQIRPENHVTGDSSFADATKTSADSAANRTSAEDKDSNNEERQQLNNHQKVTVSTETASGDAKNRRRRRRQRSVMENLTVVPGAQSSERLEELKSRIEEDLDLTVESDGREGRQVVSSDSEIEDFKGYTSDGQPVHFERRLNNKSYENVEEEEDGEEEEDDDRLTSSREDVSAAVEAAPPPTLRDDEPMEIDDPPGAADDEAFDEGPIDSDDDGYVEEDGEEEGDEEEAAEEEDLEEDEQPEPVVETRKVPKLSLKLKPGAFPEIEQHRNSGDDFDEEPDEDEEDSDNNRTHNDDLEDQLLESETEQKEEPQNVSTTDNDAEICNDEDLQALTEETTKEQSTVVEEDKDEDSIRVAGPDVNIVELELEQPLDKFDIRLLLQKCLKATTATCIYCNHARKIAVNGKQLGLHAIAEHRFSAVVSSITAEELIPESFVAKIKEHLPSLDQVFFSLESSLSADEGVTFSHVFECFQCRYATTVHKELYLHNRKLHAKNLLLCIMCKSGFYSYSELICHLCPGVYILGYDVQFRCCMCIGDDLPSSFRLMVHLRKRHHCCDVCLEMCHSQSKLSNHVWKHKLHHFCYRCCITYRNKPDITRHLFWKHGTESVMCKKCLQKKWPHVYHFCVPPTSFTCDECQLMFTKAVTLKVHKRLHTDEKPHACTIDECTERFVSKKLLAKHEQRHREPPPEEEKEIIDIVEDAEEANDNKDKDGYEESKENKDGVDKEEEEKVAVEEKEKVKPKVDVYDLPELNLSESDSSDSEDEAKKEQAAATKVDAGTSSNEQQLDKPMAEEPPVAVDNPVVDSVGTSEQSDAAVIDAASSLAMNVDEDVPGQPNDVTGSQMVLNIWDNFKTYQANKEKFDSLLTETEKTDDVATAPEPVVSLQEQEDLTLEIIMRDHDYCINPDDKPADVTFTEVKPDLSQSVDHDYCFAKEPAAAVEATEVQSIPDTPEEQVNAETSQETAVQAKSSPKKSQNNSSSGDSSSDSDSSSCSCGPNCSCSSTSGSSSSTSDSSNSDSSTEEGRKRQQLRREKRKQKKNKEQKSNKAANKANNNEQQSNVTTAPVEQQQQQAPPVRQPLVVAESPIEETDLETTESETDEEFYDKQPQKLAQQLLEEKRKQLVLAGVLADPSTPNGTLSRPATPNLPPGEDTTEVVNKPRKKSKSKKKKKRKSERREQQQQLLLSSLEESNRNNEDEDEEDTLMSNVPSYYHQPFYHHNSHHQPAATPTVPPVTLTLARNSPIQQTPIVSIKLPKIEPTPATSMTGVEMSRGGGGGGDDSNSSEMTNLRASKRRRVPNKFYGYSSDEDETPSAAKWRKTEPPQYEPQYHHHQQQQAQMLASSSHQQQHTSYTAATMVAPSRVVPPLTIKAVMPGSPGIAPPVPVHHYHSQPRVQPFSIKTAAMHQSSSRMRALQHQPSLGGAASSSSSTITTGSHSNNRRMPPIKLKTPKPQQPYHSLMLGHQMESEDEEGSNDSSANEGRSISNTMTSSLPLPTDPTALYCYCKCPYDEVSEMIGCDASDCEIEWFHFECVGIMVPPKGHWFCPECRKKRHQRKGELAKTYQRPRAGTMATAQHSTLL